MVPNMHLRHGVSPGTHTAICPDVPDTPAWTSATPFSAHQSPSASLDPMLSRQSRTTSHPANIPAVSGPTGSEWASAVTV